ncbi:MAG: hypothetical protein P4M05_32510, partial [Bradyrhizobium sp.]|nr:hypothetical protein [Bradyrhizobium sp.]
PCSHGAPGAQGRRPSRNEAAGQLYANVRFQALIDLLGKIGEGPLGAISRSSALPKRTRAFFWKPEFRAIVMKASVKACATLLNQALSTERGQAQAEPPLTLIAISYSLIRLKGTA